MLSWATSSGARLHLLGLDERRLAVMLGVATPYQLYQQCPTKEYGRSYPERIDCYVLLRRALAEFGSFRYRQNPAEHSQSLQTLAPEVCVCVLAVVQDV
jgi:hypothetical protein